MFFYGIIFVLPLLVCIKAEREIFVNQSPAKYSCYFQKTCDGSGNSPFGSLLEALEEVSSSVNDVSIVFQNPEYLMYKDEMTQYSKNYGKSSSIFKSKTAVPRRIALIGMNNKTKLNFKEIYFSFDLVEESLLISDMDIIFENMGVLPLSGFQKYFIQIRNQSSQPSLRTLSFQNISFEVKMVPKGVLLNGTLISILNPKVRLNFQNSSLLLKENNIFEYFIFSQYDIIQKDQKDEGIGEVIFNNCQFFGNKDYKEAKIYFKNISVFITYSKFQVGTYWWNIGADLSTLVLKEVIIFLSFDLNQDTQKTLFAVKKSNFKVTNVIITGDYDYSISNTLVKPFYGFIAQETYLVVNNIKISGTFFQIFRLEIYNEMIAHGIDLTDNYGYVIYADNGNKVSCFSSVLTRNFGGCFLLVRNNSAYILKTNFMQLRNVGRNGSAIQFNEANKDLRVLLCLFFTNAATLNGGSICIGKLNNDWTVDNCTFINCTAQSSGGAIYIDINNKNWMIHHSTFKNCSIRSSFGGTISVLTGNTLWLMLYNSIENSFGYAGGCVYLNVANQYWLILRMTFKNCSSYNPGGVLYIGDNSYRWTIKHSSIENNKASLYGAGIHIVSNNFHWLAYNVTLENSAANQYGGGLSVGTGSTHWLIIYSNFSNNKAVSYGAGIFVASNNVNWTIFQTNFVNNSAGTHGGAIYIQDANKFFTMYSLTFSQNTAEKYGGVVYLGASNTDMNILNCSFLNNRALILSSEFYSRYSFQNCNFSQMRYSGSVFRIGADDVLNFVNCDFDNISPIFPGNPIFLLVSSNNSLILSMCALRKLDDYILNDNSENSKLNISQTYIELNTNFNHDDVFLLRSLDLMLVFIMNKISLLLTIKNQFTFFAFGQEKFNVIINQISFDTLKKISTMIKVEKSLRINFQISNFNLFNFEGAFIKVDSPYYNSVNLNISHSIFTVNSSLLHFMEIQNGSSILIEHCTFLLSRLHSRSALNFYGVYNGGNLTLRRTVFRLLSQVNDFYLKENSDSQYGLIHAVNGLERLVIEQGSIFLGHKNFKSLIQTSLFTKIIISASHIFGNYLNQRSSLLILGLCQTCSILINSSKLENNRVVYGSLANYEFQKDRVNVSDELGYNLEIGGYSKIRKNIASLQGGHFYVNGTSYSGVNISEDIKTVVLNKIRLGESSSYDSMGSLIFFFEAESDNLFKLKSNLNGIKSMFETNFKKKFKDVKLNSLVSSYKIFTKELESDASPVTFTLDGDLTSNSSFGKNFPFCLAVFDAFDQKLALTSETDVNPLLNKRSLIPSITVNSTQISFTFNRGQFCTNRFYFSEDDYALLRGEVKEISITPTDMKEFLPKINEKNISYTQSYAGDNLLPAPPVYHISFKIQECLEENYLINNVCTSCRRSTFLSEKVQGNTMKCENCRDLDNYYCYGGSMRSPKLNFWRYSNLSNNFLRCPFTSCLGDPYFDKNSSEIDCINCFLPGSDQQLLVYSYHPNSTSIGFCKHGYRGNMCSSCDQGFGSSAFYQCTDCSLLRPYIYQFITALLNFILFYYTCWVSIKNSSNSANVDTSSKKFIDNVASSYLLNIFFLYFNIIGVLKLLPFEKSEYIEDAIKFFSEITPTEKVEIFSFGCLLKMLDINLPSIFLETLVNLIFFGISSMILLFMFVLQRKKAKNYVPIIPSIKGVFLIYLMNNQIRLLTPNFRLLYCVNLGDTNLIKNQLLLDLSQECDSDLHYYFKNLLSIPLILIFCVIVPGFIIYNLFINRSKNQDTKFLLTYGYFIYPFRKQALYFQIFAILNMLIIINFKEIFIYMIITNNQPAAPSLLICYLLLFYFLHKTISPYDPKKYWKLQKMSLLSLKTNISNALAALIWTLMDNSADSTYSLYLIGVYLGVTNFVFIFILGWVYFFSKKENILNKLRNNTGIIFRRSRFLSNARSINQDGKASNKKDFEEIFSQENLLRENQKLKILIELLISHVRSKKEENQQTSSSYFESVPEEGLKSNINRYMFNKHETKIDEEKFLLNTDSPFPSERRDHLQSPVYENENPDPLIKMNEIDLIENKQTIEQMSLQETKIRGSTTKKQMLQSERNTSASYMPINSFLISKKLVGSQLYHHFLKLKYQMIAPPGENFKKEKSTGNNIMSILGDESRNWFIAVRESKHKQNVVNIYLRRAMEWLSPPFSESVTIGIDYQSRSVQIKARVSLFDFIKVKSLEWDIKNFNAEMITDPLVSEKTALSFSDNIFKNKLKDRNKITGDIQLISPFFEKNTQTFRIETFKSGSLKIYGNSSFTDNSILMNVVKEYLGKIYSDTSDNN